MDASYLASQVTFVTNENVDGEMVECRTSFQNTNNITTGTTTLQVASRSECRHSLTWVGVGEYNIFA
jgi:hypothetical protein